MEDALFTLRATPQLAFCPPSDIHFPEVRRCLERRREPRSQGVREETDDCVRWGVVTMNCVARSQRAAARLPVCGSVPDVSTLLLAVAPALLSQTSGPSRSVRDGVYTEAQAQRGQPLYNQLCASCHGDRLSGAEEAPDLAGGAFLASWNGATANDLFERIRVSMPQNRPGSLSRQQNVDVVVFIFRANQFPAGKTELASAAEQLKQIRFEASKPTGKEP